jgi:hypothetical protein
MLSSSSRTDRLIQPRPRPEFSRGAGLLALASLVALAVAGCKGEEALYARDAAVFSGLGGGSGGGAAAGKGGAGTAGQGGSLGTGGVGSGGNNGSGGATGGQGGVGGAGGQPTGNYGDACQSDGDCNGHGTCHKAGGGSGLCCNVDCPGTCQTCGSDGNTCVNVMSGLDPRDDCPATDPTMGDCSNDGTCNGSGMCKAWLAGTPCSTASSCAGTDKVISGGICSGNTGACQANSPVSCNGFLCESNACLTTCTDGTACVTGGFCGAGSCVGPTPNLAGNGDAEDGITPPPGWSSINSNTGVSSSAHTGMYSIAGTGRTAYWNGPGYYIPTGLGKYDVSVWAMQNQVEGDPPLITGVLQLRLICASGAPYYLNGTVASEPMPQGTWVNFTGEFNSAMDSNTGSDCAPDNHNGFLPGVVQSAIVFLQDSTNDPSISMNKYVDFYMDDLVVTVPDSHNLVGNPTFEDSAKVVAGWTGNSVGTGSLGVTSMYAHMGTQSLQQTKRTLPGTGIRFALPIGAANYAITIYATHSGAVAHTLRLQAAYICLHDPVTIPPTYRTKTIFQTGGSSGTADPKAGTWVALSGTFAFPPANAPADCQQMTDVDFWVTQGDGDSATGCGTGTGQIECPDLFVDDASVMLTNAPPPP